MSMFHATTTEAGRGNSSSRRDQGGSFTTSTTEPRPSRVPASVASTSGNGSPISATRCEFSPVRVDLADGAHDVAGIVL